MTLDELISQRKTLADQRAALGNQLSDLDDQIRLASATERHSDFIEWANSHNGKLIKATLQRGLFIGTLDATLHTETVDAEPYVTLHDAIGMPREFGQPSLRRIDTSVELWARDFKPSWTQISLEEANKLISEYSAKHFTLK